MKVTVKLEDIEKGERFGFGKGCPIKLALRRKGFTDVMVGPNTIEYFDRKKTHQHKFLPRIAVAFITNFDMQNREFTPEPFTFEC